MKPGQKKQKKGGRLLCLVLFPRRGVSWVMPRIPRGQLGGHVYHQERAALRTCVTRQAPLGAPGWVEQLATALVHAAITRPPAHTPNKVACPLFSLSPSSTFSIALHDLYIRPYRKRAGRRADWDWNPLSSVGDRPLASRYKHMAPDQQQQTQTGLPFRTYLG